MAISGVVLAEGQLAATKGTIYTVPASTIVYIRFFRLSNTSAVSIETVKIYLKTGSTSRLILPVDINPGEAVDVIEDAALILEAGDLIEGQATDASTVDYVITGGV